MLALVLRTNPSRSALRGEVRNGLRQSLFEDGKVSRRQVGHVMAGSVGDRHRQRHELDARFVSARLGQQRVRLERDGSENDAHRQDHARTECFVHVWLRETTTKS